MSSPKSVIIRIFLFPAEFQKFLPFPCEPIRDIPGPGHSSELVLRKKLLEITRGGSNLPVIDGEKFRLNVTDGELLMGKKAFKAEYLHKWQKAGWAGALAKRKADKFRAEQFCLTDAVSYALSLLRPDEWLTAGQLCGLFAPCQIPFQKHYGTKKATR